MNLFNQINSENLEDESRQRIIDSALELFLEFGLRRTTMEDVAKKASIGRATLYRRFSDKEELLKAVIMREAQREIKNVENSASQFTNIVDSVIEAFVISVTLIHKHPLLARILSTEPDFVLPFLTIHFDEILSYSREYLASQIKLGQDMGVMNDFPAETTAEFILRIIHSLMLTPKGAITPTNEKSLREFARLYILPVLIHPSFIK